MENYKKKIINRNKGSIVLVLLLACVIIILLNLEDKLPQVEDFIKGFSAGVFSGFEVVLIINIVKNLIVIKDEKKLKKQYIKETDERACLIVQKMGSVGMLTAIFILLFMTIIAGFFNKIAFFSFLSATVVVETIMLVLKVYYSRKF